MREPWPKLQWQTRAQRWASSPLHCPMLPAFCTQGVKDSKLGTARECGLRIGRRGVRQS